jgi:hypothetical protein
VFLVIEYYNHFQITEMYAVLLLVFMTAIGLNAIFGWLPARQGGSTKNQKALNSFSSRLSVSSCIVMCSILKRSLRVSSMQFST